MVLEDAERCVAHDQDASDKKRRVKARVLEQLLRHHTIVATIRKATSHTLTEAGKAGLPVNDVMAFAKARQSAGDTKGRAIATTAVIAGRIARGPTTWPLGPAARVMASSSGQGVWSFAAGESRSLEGGVRDGLLDFVDGIKFRIADVCLEPGPRGHSTTIAFSILAFFAQAKVQPAMF